MDSALAPLPPDAAVPAPAPAPPAGLGDAPSGDDDSAPLPSSLQPWEQHAGVIHMPRYLYSSLAAPLLHRSGFLVTCAFQSCIEILLFATGGSSWLSQAANTKRIMCDVIVELPRVEREKSATKEAMEILHEFLDVTKSRDGVIMEPDAKRARTGAFSGSTRQKPPVATKGQEEPIAQEARAGQGEEQTPAIEVQGIDDDDATRNGLDVCNAAPAGDSVVREIQQQEFHLVKLARNGMVYISIPSRSPGDLVAFMATILKDFHTRSRAAPRWCHRIFPAQVTCIWSKDDVHSTVVVLVKDFLQGHTISSNNPLKYAVAVNRRGLEEKEKTGEAAASTFLFGKLDCIHAVTEAIQSLTPYISVDLTNPQMVVFLEVLPLVRVETTVCAVSVLPREIVVTKPKLVIQALAPPKKQNKKKSSKKDGLQEAVIYYAESINEEFDDGIMSAIGSSLHHGGEGEEQRKRRHGRYHCKRKILAIRWVGKCFFFVLVRNIET